MALIERIAKISPKDELLVVPGSVGVDLPEPKPFIEFGTSGLLRTRGVGYVYDEFLTELSTSRAKQVYREMRDNDAVIGAMFFALEMILRRAEWRVEAGEGKDAEKLADFVKECMEDLSHTWEDFVAECVSMFAFGFALFECVYKRRKGPDGPHSSKFDDGKIGWRKFAPRAQESILYWIWDEEGGLQGTVQLAAPDYRTISIPIEKLLLFRTTSLKNNPEGRSVLRNCYRSWTFKKRIEEIENIGIERDLCGIPVLYMSAEALATMQLGGVSGFEAARKLVRDIKIDDQAGVVLPQAFDDRGNKHVELQLLRAAGAKQTNPSETIGRYNSDILNTMLAGFVQFGQSPTGSRALHVSATEIFALAIGAFMDSVAAVMTRVAIPRLLSLNGMNLEAAPKIKAGEIGVRDLEELSDYVSKLAASGMTFFDKPTVDYLRKAGRLPEAPEGDESAPQFPPGMVPGQPIADPSKVNFGAARQTQQGAPPEKGAQAPPPPGAKKPPKEKEPESDQPKDKEEARERLRNAV